MNYGPTRRGSMPHCWLSPAICFPGSSRNAGLLFTKKPAVKFLIVLFLGSWSASSAEGTRTGSRISARSYIGSCVTRLMTRTARHGSKQSGRLAIHSLAANVKQPTETATLWPSYWTQRTVGAWLSKSTLRGHSQVSSGSSTRSKLGDGYTTISRQLNQSIKTRGR
jgi:hypothetical protein